MKYLILLVMFGCQSEPKVNYKKLYHQEQQCRMRLEVNYVHKTNGTGGSYSICDIDAYSNHCSCNFTKEDK